MESRSPPCSRSKNPCNFCCSSHRQKCNKRYVTTQVDSMPRSKWYGVKVPSRFSGSPEAPESFPRRSPTAVREPRVRRTSGPGRRSPHRSAPGTPVSVPKVTRMRDFLCESRGGFDTSWCRRALRLGFPHAAMFAGAKTVPEARLRVSPVRSRSNVETATTTSLEQH